MVKKIVLLGKLNLFRYKICYFLIFIIIVSGALLFSDCSMNYNGEKIFHRQGCVQCHTFKGKGGRMGPDLSAVTNLKSDSWIESYIQNPKKMNPFSRMPSFKHLSKSKRKAIISFLKK
jgi:cbb3-type cytochrome oxidase cytochrome c subunit